jgi:hypothetical protein
MPSPWIIHVKAYQQKHNCSYKDAMSRAKSTYKKKQKRTQTQKGGGKFMDVLNTAGISLPGANLYNFIKKPSIRTAIKLHPFMGGTLDGVDKIRDLVKRIKK